MKVEHHPRSLNDYLRLFFTGVAMGTVDVIPGVSGGTMAFILGIYEDLLTAIKSFDLTLLQHLIRGRVREALDYVPWQFLLALLLGIGMAIFSLAHGISWMLDNQPVFLFAFFFGLIIASIVAIGATVAWRSTTFAMLIVGTLVALAVVNLVPMEMPHDPLTLFLSGIVAIMAMILPGISGSFLLLILGQYNFVLEAVKTFDLISLAAVGAGAAVGLLGFARVLSWLLARYHQPTIALLVGFMVGSLWEIWPWKTVVEWADRHGELVPIVERNVLPRLASTEVLVVLLLALAGFVIVSYLDHMMMRANPFFRLFKR